LQQDAIPSTLTGNIAGHFLHVGVHGACLWNFAATLQDDPRHGNISFRAGAGGLHSAEN
jgi:hypothetical protein